MATTRIESEVQFRISRREAREREGACLSSGIKHKIASVPSCDTRVGVMCDDGLTSAKGHKKNGRLCRQRRVVFTRVNHALCRIQLNLANSRLFLVTFKPFHLKTEP